MVCGGEEQQQPLLIFTSRPGRDEGRAWAPFLGTRAEHQSGLRAGGIRVWPRGADDARAGGSIGGGGGGGTSAWPIPTGSQ